MVLHGFLLSAQYVKTQEYLYECFYFVLGYLYGSLDDLVYGFIDVNYFINAGSPNGARESSPALPKENSEKTYDDRRKQDDRRDLSREYGRSQYGRTNDSHKYYGRHSSRSTDGYHRYDDYKREKCAEEDDRKYPRSSRSGRDRAGDHSDYTSRDSQQNRSRGDRHDSDKYTRGKTDYSGHRSRERYGGSSPVEYQKDRGSSPDRVGSGDRQTNLSSGGKSADLDKNRGTKHERDDRRDYQRRHNSTSRRDNSGPQVRETSGGEYKESDRLKHSKQEKREVLERSEGRASFSSESLEKKPKLYGFDGSKDQGKYGMVLYFMNLVFYFMIFSYYYLLLADLRCYLLPIICIQFL